jgi:hypothetical protein
MRTPRQQQQQQQQQQAIETKVNKALFTNKLSSRRPSPGVELTVGSSTDKGKFKVHFNYRPN